MILTNTHLKDFNPMEMIISIIMIHKAIQTNLTSFSYVGYVYLETKVWESVEKCRVFKPFFHKFACLGHVKMWEN